MESNFTNLLHTQGHEPLSVDDDKSMMKLDKQNTRLKLDILEISRPRKQQNNYLQIKTTST